MLVGRASRVSGMRNETGKRCDITHRLADDPAALPFVIATRRANKQNPRPLVRRDTALAWRSPLLSP